MHSRTSRSEQRARAMTEINTKPAGVGKIHYVTAKTRPQENA